MKKIIIFYICLNIFLMPAFAYIIEDDFVDKTIDKNLKIKQHSYIPIVDNFAQSNQNKNIPKKGIGINETLPSSYQKFEKRPIFIDENCTEVKARIKKLYSTRYTLDEGDYIDFETIEEVKINNKIYPKNTTIKARLETISKNKTYGVPSDLVVGNFRLDDTILSGEISKTGANRTLWLRPTVYVLSCFFGLGLPLILIRGGHAKIKPSETFVLYAK